MNKCQTERLQEAVRAIAAETTFTEENLLRFRSFENESDPPAGGIRLPITIMAAANFNNWQLPAIPTARGLKGLVVRELIFALEDIYDITDKQLWELRGLGVRIVDEQIQELLHKRGQFK